jgi:RNA polymerase sigma-70 factor (ECF subfamily)
MLRFQRGDVGSFAELVQRHKTPLFNFVRRHLRSPHAAEDLLQDTFLRVVQNSAEFKHEARFATWLYTIARNLCIDHFRKASLRSYDSLDRPRTDNHRPLSESAEDHGPRGSVERSAVASELREKIAMAIEILPEDQREVFLLREVANLPFKEIAQITSTPENTVKSRMRYALERLQSSLQVYEDDARALE